MIAFSNNLLLSAGKKTWRSAFSLFNSAALIVFLIYLALVAAGRPVYYAKLSDHFDQIIFDSSKNHIPKDLQFYGPGVFRQFEYEKMPIKGLEFFDTESDLPSIYFFPGGGVLPQEPVFAYLALLGLKKGGYIRPGFLVRQNNNKLKFDYDGVNYRKHFFSETEDAPSPVCTALITCARKDGLALAFLGKKALLFDAFFFRIPKIRTWQRFPMPRDVEPSTGKLRPL